MKSKQTLSIEQMRHLGELGLDTSNASASWYKPDMGTEYMQTFGHMLKEELVGNEESIPAYTLQDVLDALPSQVEFLIEMPSHLERNIYKLRIKKMFFDEGYVKYLVMYEKEYVLDYIALYSDEVLIDAAYEMLCWAIEYGKVATNKNE